VHPALVLVHSPLVRPLTWKPVAQELEAAGHAVIVPSLADAVATGPPYHRKIAQAVVAAIDADNISSVILVGHSGAGALLPVMADASEVSVVGAIYVDSLLPHPAG
jgi:pimeloyl-ACP methyl ester carboxylesterase